MRRRINEWWLGSIGTSYNSSYQAVLDRTTALGGTIPNAAGRTKENAWVVEMKAIGAWDLASVIYKDRTNGDRIHAKINYKTPGTFDLTEVDGGNLTFTQDLGFNGNGTSSYLTTGWDPANNGGSVYTQNECGIIVYCHTAGAADVVDAAFGAGGAAAQHATLLQIKRNLSGSKALHQINEATTDTIANLESRGLYQLERTLINATALFKNGSSIDTTAILATGRTPQDFYYGAYNDNGSAALFSSKIHGLLIIGASMTGLEASIDTAWDNFIAP